jgi:Asp-tRNA(Asn)/Glu-tRNA(Gln) amidotransferase A subunit family amidase
MVSLCFESALHIAAQLRRRELSAVECLEYFRARVERLNPALNAIVVLDWSGLTKPHAAQTRRWRRISPSGRCTACR